MAMVVPPVDHDCVLKDVVEAQANEIAKLKHDMEQLKKALIGPKSERSKMPRPDVGKKSTVAERLAKRRANAAAKKKLQTVRTELKVPADAKSCPDCGAVDAMKPVGSGRETTVFEFIPARWIRHVYVQEVLRCECRNYVVTAPGAPKVVARGRYSASFLAHLAVAKCADSIPIYRIEKDYQRQGIPIARSTMNSLLHTASEITKPIWIRILEKIKVRAVVQADETRLPRPHGVSSATRTDSCSSTSTAATTRSRRQRSASVRGATRISGATFTTRSRPPQSRRRRSTSSSSSIASSTRRRNGAS
jgi:transposase